MKDKSLHNRCGIYAIEHLATSRFYIGSSKAIYDRWYRHRWHLQRGTHHSPLLQADWKHYGADAFEFYVLEDCAEEDLLVREQVYLDAFHPVFNIAPFAHSRRGVPHDEQTRAKMRATQSARAALVTHCPRGHVYDDANTHVNKKGKRICRRCNADRVNRIFHTESPEQREIRRQQMKQNYEAKRSERLEAMRLYASTRKEAKRLYDRARRERLKCASA